MCMCVTTYIYRVVSLYTSHVRISLCIDMTQSWLIYDMSHVIYLCASNLSVHILCTLLSVLYMTWVMSYISLHVMYASSHFILSTHLSAHLTCACYVWVLRVCVCDNTHLQGGPSMHRIHACDMTHPRIADRCIHGWVTDESYIYRVVSLCVCAHLCVRSMT